MSTHAVYDAILARRSIRNFTDVPVERDKIETLLKAAMAAPSACNLQPWEFIAVDDPKMLEKVKNTPSQGQYNAPLAIVICGTYKHIPWGGDGWMLDCGALTWYTEDAVHWQKFDNTRKRKMRSLQSLQDDIDAGII